MNKMQKGAFKRMLKSLEAMSIAIKDFNADCEKKQNSLNLKHNDLIMYEDYERLSECALSGINSAITHIGAIIDY